jgi:hypothetical protein
MNWKLIFGLSLFGLAMGIGTVFVIPWNVEPFCWLVIFLICAYLIARSMASYRFLTGVALGVVNSIWITASHLIFFDRYVHHLGGNAAEILTGNATPVVVPPPIIATLLGGPVIGLISGAVIGLLALLAGRFVRPPSSIV